MQLHQIQARVSETWDALYSQSPKLSAFGTTAAEIDEAFLKLNRSTSVAVETAMRAVAGGIPLPQLTPAEMMVAALRLRWASGALDLLQAWERLEYPAPMEHSEEKILLWLLIERWDYEGFGSIADTLEDLVSMAGPTAAAGDRN